MLLAMFLFLFWCLRRPAFRGRPLIPPRLSSRHAAGKQSCSILASTTVLGEPCFGTAKTLAVSVECDSPSKAYAFTLAVTVPPTSAGEVWVPLFGAIPATAAIAEGGIVVWDGGAFKTGAVPGVVSAKAQPGYIVFTTLSGAYVFQV